MLGVPLLAVVVTALALYFSGGVLDQIVTETGLVRVAMLPPWQAIGGFLTVGGLALLWLDRRRLPRRTATAVRPPLGPLVLPTLGLAVLVIPYLPVLPDVWPALQILAGPIGAGVWLVVIMQIVWTLWQARLVRVDWVAQLTARRLAIAIGVLTVLIVGAGAVRLTSTGLYPAGDEPHYLVIAQSLWRDGDLQIENNHNRRDYREHYPRELEPHYLTRGADGEIYSIHPVGMPVVMAPVYAAGGYRAVVVAFILMAGLAAAIMWRTTLAATNALGATTFAWAAVVATTPFFFNAFAIYPEVPAALAVAVAIALTFMPPATIAHWVWIGVACAALPWLSTKYAPMSAALVAVASARAIFPAGSRRNSPDLSRAEKGSPPSSTSHAVAAVTVPYVISLAGWFYFFYAIWGAPLPQAPYGDLVQTSPWNVVFGVPGLLFDQEYGLLPYAPVYILAGTGLWAMWRHDDASRRRAVEVAVVFALLLGTVGAFRIWWGGSAPPGRPLTSGLLLLSIPIAFAFRSAPAGSAARAAQHLLLWASIGLTMMMLFAQQGFLTANHRDGTSALLEYLSPRWPAWTLAPSFIHHEAGTALFHTLVWLALAGAAAFALRALRGLRPGAASLAAILVTTSALLLATIIMPRLPLTPEWPGLDVRARSRLPLFDEFDTLARPVAIEYSPIRFADPNALISHASVFVEPDLRRERQPLRVLHNGRFSLPAGEYRLEIEWSGARNGETIGLQLGRTGDPFEQWTVDARPGETWSTQFALPLDASFVGVRGTPELERVVQKIRIVPLEIVDAGRRPRRPVVIAASRSGPASIYYYDANVSREPGGFWVLGNRHTRVTIARPPSEGPLILRVHSGPIANRLHLSTFGWQHTMALKPSVREDIEVPVNGDTLVTLELSTDVVFVPQQWDPASADTRTLGVWVEVVQ